MSTNNIQLWILGIGSRVDMTGYTLDYTAGVYPHQENLTLLGHLFQHFVVAIIPQFDMLSGLLY